MDGWITYVTQMHCVETGPGEIRMVRDQGVLMLGLLTPRPV